MMAILDVSRYCLDSSNMEKSVECKETGRYHFYCKITFKIA